MADRPTDATLRRRPSLKRALTVMAAALAIPLLALQMWWAYHDYGMARERAENTALAFADATALGVLQFFAQSEALMTAMIGQFGPEGFLGEACSENVETVAAFQPFLTNVAVVGENGAVICSHVEMQGTVSANSWPWWDEVRSNPVFTIGDPAEADITRGWILPMVVPLTDGAGNFSGAVVGSMQLADLSSYFGIRRLPENHLITVATDQGIVIARSHDAERMVGNPIPTLTGWDREVEPGRWVATGPDLNGVDRTWGQVAIPPDWIVYVGVPDADVLGPALQAALANLGLALVIVLIGALLSAHSYRGIAIALRELANRTRRIAQGEPVPVPARTPSEFADVVERFNETMSAREEAQNRARRARDRYQSLFDNSVFGLYVSTLDGRFIEVNPALADMLGYDSPKALVDAGPEVVYADPDEARRLAEQSLSTGEIPAHEMDWLRADGMPISVRIGGKLAPGPADESVLEVIVQDITEERRMEEERRQTQKMEAIGQLAGGVAHDFNNLLTVIGGNVELLEDDISEDNPIRHDLAEISQATRRAASLTRRLLTFSSRQPQGRTLEDANEAISGLRKLLEPLIGENVHLKTELEDRPLPIAIDPGDFEQIVLNLVLNARDALPRGGTIRIATAESPGHGMASYGHDGPGMTLTVTDDGIGMHPDIASRIFEPFYTTKAVGQGTGLGLATVYGIVKRASGLIDVDTNVGDGTTIRIWVPLTEYEAQDDETVRNTIERGDETILVVEDEDLLMSLVRRALTDSGYRVLTASNGAAALDLIRDESPSLELVLTDVVMPLVGGLELADELATILPDVPVLFMTGYVANEHLSERIKGRAEFLLRKPFSTAELRARVRHILDLCAVD